MKDRTYKQIDTLTSLRFVAAGLIVIHHSRGVLVLPSDLFERFVFDQGVSFFFVLSGFILSHVYPSLNGSVAIRNYLIARVARVWPLHVAAFILVFVLFLPWSVYDLTKPQHMFLGILNLLMVQGWVPIKTVYMSFNAVAWTISTEMLFYLSFPFLINRFEMNGVKKLAIAAVLVVGLVVICNVMRLPSDAIAPNRISIDGVLYVNPLSRIFEFILGMCAYRLYQSISPYIGLSKLGWSAIEIVVVVLAGLSIYSSSFVADSVNSLLGPGGSIYFVHSGSSAVFAVLIVIMAFEKGIISDVMRMRIPILLGEISYAVYLFHQIILRFLSVHVQQLMFIPKPTVYVLFWIFLLGLAGLSWVFIEKPSRRFLLNWAHQRSGQ